MSHEHVEVARRLLAAGDDLPAALACLDPEVEFIPQRAETEGAYVGHAGYAKFLADTRELFDSFERHFELAEVGDRVISWGTIRVRGRVSGVVAEGESGGVFEFRDGLIVRWEDLGSKAGAFKAAGLEEA